MMRAMDIDLDQLPIPDWGIECPRCRYRLVGLPSHRCPECGVEFDMADVVKPWHRLREPRFTGHELPLPDFGMCCAGCQEPLVGARGRACPSCGEPFDPESVRPVKEWLIVDQPMCGDVTLAGIEVLLGVERVPYTRAAGKLLREIYGGTDVVGSRLLVPREFYFEVLWLIRRAVLDMQRVREHPEADWTCSKCGEEVPGHFDVCWNCETPRA